MQIELLGATHLSDHTKFWETEHRFETMEIPAHGFLRLVVFFWRGLSRILRGILRLSISGSQPLAIDLRHWPQIWRRANYLSLVPAVNGLIGNGKRNPRIFAGSKR